MVRDRAVPDLVVQGLAAQASAAQDLAVPEETATGWSRNRPDSEETRTAGSEQTQIMRRDRMVEARIRPQLPTDLKPRRLRMIQAPARLVPMEPTMRRLPSRPPSS